MKKNKILVTGGAGFEIGSHVTKLLIDSRYDVVILDNLSHGLKENVDKRAKLIIGDISDRVKAKEALVGVDAVYTWLVWLSYLTQLRTLLNIANVMSWKLLNF